MSDYNPIIYFVSAIGAEVIKDVSKNIAKKCYEIAESLRQPIIQLNINDYNNIEEVEQKLKAHPKIANEIEKKISENPDGFEQLFNFFKESPSLTINKFYNVNNKNVINIEINHGKINM